MSVIREEWDGATTPYEGQNVANINAVINISPHLKPDSQFPLTPEDYQVGNSAIMVSCAHDLPSMVRRKNNIRKKGPVHSVSTRQQVFSNFNMWKRDTVNFKFDRVNYPDSKPGKKMYVLIAKNEKAAGMLMALQFSGVSRAAVNRNGVSGNRNGDIAIHKTGVVNIHVALQDLINCKDGFAHGQPLALNIHVARTYTNLPVPPNEYDYDESRKDIHFYYYIGLCPIRFKNEPDTYWRVGVRRATPDDYLMKWVIGNVWMTGEGGQNYALTELTEAPRLRYFGPLKRKDPKDGVDSSDEDEDSTEEVGLGGVIGGGVSGGGSVSGRMDTEADIPSTHTDTKTASSSVQPATTRGRKSQLKKKRRAISQGTTTALVSSRTGNPTRVTLS